MFKVHHAPLDFKGEITCREFDSIDETRFFICDIIYPLKMVSDRVFLVSVNDELIVTENALFIHNLFINNEFDIDIFTDFETNIFIQEFYSYEEAYKVALMMKETSSLCYEQK